MIKFKTIRWKNFLSTGDSFTEIPLNAFKQSLMVGKNGAGKSTLLDAISFVMFGKPYRKILKPTIPNSITKKNCVVELEFEANGAEFKIIRGIKPNTFELFRDGMLVDKKINYQTHLEEDVLRLNQKSFTQVDIVGSANYKPFMQLDGPERRVIIEDILDLSIFSTMNILLKERVAENKAAITANDADINLVKNKIELNKKHVKAMLESNEELIATKRERIEFYSNKRKDAVNNSKELQNSNIEFQEKIDSLIPYNEQLKTIDSMKGQLSDRLSKISKQITFYEATDVCPTCTQSIEAEFKRQTLATKTEKYKEIEASIKELIKESDQAYEKVREFTSIQQVVNTNNRQLAELNMEIANYNRFVEDLMDEINTLNRQKNSIQVDDQGEALNNELQAQLSKKEELIDDREVLSVAATMLKDGGIKSLIIRKFIPEINKTVNRYLQELDFYVKFELDENFNETIKSRYRDEFTYENFSQGEKARIDLALLLTWRHIAKMRNSISTNLLILDEVFDGSLDVDGADDLMRILNMLSVDTNVIVISHKDVIIDKFETVMHFKKEQNFSTMELVNGSRS